MPGKKNNKSKAIKHSKPSKTIKNARSKMKLKAKPVARKGVATAQKAFRKAGEKSPAHRVIRVGKAASRPEGSRAIKKTPSRPTKPINGHSQRIHGAGKDAVSNAARVITNPVAKLSRSDLEYFRRRLLEKRREILGDVGSMESEAFRNQDNHSSSPMHMADVGTDNFEQEFTLGLIESERLLLKEIQESLNRIDDGTFGVCVATGKPIGKARLEAKPWAKYCIEYARMLENGGMLRNGSDHTATVEVAEEEDD